MFLCLYNWKECWGGEPWILPSLASLPAGHRVRSGQVTTCPETLVQLETRVSVLREALEARERRVVEMQVVKVLVHLVLTSRS